MAIKKTVPIDKFFCETCKRECESEEAADKCRQMHEDIKKLKELTRKYKEIQKEIRRLCRHWPDYRLRIAHEEGIDSCDRGTTYYWCAICDMIIEGRSHWRKQKYAENYIKIQS